VDLLAVVKRDFSVEVHQSTIGKWLHRLDLTRLQPRPVHPKKDSEVETTFKTNFASLVKQALLATTAATPIEIWFRTRRGSAKRERTHTSGRDLPKVPSGARSFKKPTTSPDPKPRSG
jgi:hypothetical protein